MLDAAEKDPNNRVSIEWQQIGAIIRVIGAKSIAPISSRHGAVIFFCYAAISKGCMICTKVPNFLNKILSRETLVLQQCHRYMIDGHTCCESERIDFEAVKNRLLDIFSFHSDDYVKCYDYRYSNSNIVEYIRFVTDRNMKTFIDLIIEQMTASLANEIISYDPNNKLESDETLASVVDYVFPQLFGTRKFREFGLPDYMLPLVSSLGSKVLDIFCSDTRFWCDTTRKVITRSNLYQELIRLENETSKEEETISALKAEMQILLDITIQSEIPMVDDIFCGYVTGSALRKKLKCRVRFNVNSRCDEEKNPDSGLHQI